VCATNENTLIATLGGLSSTFIVQTTGLLGSLLIYLFKALVNNIDFGKSVWEPPVDLLRESCVNNEEAYTPAS